MNLPENFIATKKGKVVRILAAYSGKNLEIAQVEFTSNGSLYFNLTNTPLKDLQCGRAFFDRKGGKFKKDIPDKSFKSASGFHVSLHPLPGNCIHIRENKKGKIVEAVKNDWFPVTSPRNVLRFWTSPLSSLLESTKKAYFSLPVPADHNGSIYGKLDLYPVGTEKLYLPPNSFQQVYGWSPYYLVCLSFMLSPLTDPHLIYPERADQL